MLGAAVAQSTTCKVLALAGGGDKGAYQAGAIQGLVQALPAGQATWDVVTGVGIGAVNALAAARYAKGDETAMAQALVNFWQNFSSDDFYENWTGGVLQGLLSEPGLYNSAPMQQTLNTLAAVGSGFGRHLVVGATDLISGDFIVVNDTYPLSDIVAATQGSASTAGSFPPVTLDQFYLADGTIKFSVDILSGVNQCQALGFDNSDIVVDVVLCASKTLSQINMQGYKPLQVLIRYLEISAYDDTMQVLENAQVDYKNVNIRNVVVPSGVMPDYEEDMPLPYCYSSASLETMIQMGLTDAASAQAIKYS